MSHFKMTVTQGSNGTSRRATRAKNEQDWANGPSSLSQVLISSAHFLLVQPIHEKCSEFLVIVGLCFSSRNFLYYTILPRCPFDWFGLMIFGWFMPAECHWADNVHLKCSLFHCIQNWYQINHTIHSFIVWKWFNEHYVHFTKSFLRLFDIIWTFLWTELIFIFTTRRILFKLIRLFLSYYFLLID